ncbi:MAG: MBL fold metallo-hydrolase [Candidatus Thermoplasmatota archaeon]|nr:MBL fold metallo-hydrolase [Candidatus Thermoplasmatota archaeon]
MVDVIQIGSGPYDSNIFLVRGSDTNILIDCGSGSYSSRVEGSIRRNLGEADLDAIVLTHEHFDHFGGAVHLMRAFDSSLHGSPECARTLREGDPVRTGSFLFGARMDPILDVKDIGDDLKIGGLSFDVRSTPGHAPGLICLIERSEGCMFCGDLVFCDGGVGRWDLPGGDLELLRDSIERALEWEISSLYPGHGRTETRDPKGQIELARRMLAMY